MVFLTLQMPISYMHIYTCTYTQSPNLVITVFIDAKKSAYPVKITKVFSLCLDSVPTYILMCISIFHSVLIPCFLFTRFSSLKWCSVSGNYPCTLFFIYIALTLLIRHASLKVGQSYQLVFPNPLTWPLLCDHFSVSKWGSGGQGTAPHPPPPTHPTRPFIFLAQIWLI